MTILSIWNPIHLYRIGQNRMYRYVPVHTGTYQYIPVQDSLKSTYQYVQVYTINKTSMFLIHQGSSSRVNCNSVKLQCKRYARMRSNFKKFKVQISQVHLGTYLYILVRTGIDINHTHTLHFDDALAAFLRLRVWSRVTSQKQGNQGHSA